MNHCRHQVTGQAEWTLACPDCEIERLRDERDIFKRTLDKRDAERDALKQDAKRYRWIIKHMRLGIGQNGAYWSLTDATQVAPNHIGEVDATIDAALRGEE